MAEAVRQMGLKHVVVTSVDRDDLADGGAFIFAETIQAIRELHRGCVVEVLIPDFQGDEAALRTVLDAGPDILNHNIETVPRLFPAARGRRRLSTIVGSLEQLSPDLAGHGGPRPA